MKKNTLLLFMLISIFSFGQTTTNYHKTTTTKTVKKTTAKPKKSSTSKTTRLPEGVMLWTIDAQRAKCEAATTMQCLLVKKSGQKTFELFYDNINGFDYQEGYVYVIQVRQEAKTPPIPANASVYNYSLVKVVSKKAMPGFSNTFTPSQTSNSGAVKTIVVNEEKAPCSGGDKRRCLLIKEEGKKTFELYYTDISGFNFEPGYRQTLQVAETFATDPRSNQMLPKYTLLRVIKREQVQLQPHDTSTTPAGWAQGRTPLDKKWYLKNMKDSDTTSYSIVDNAVWIEFITSESRYTGVGPCNNFFGGFKTDLISNFQASAITSSKVYCSNMRLEEMFFSLLQNADHFKISEGRLTLFKGDRVLLTFE
ncbi:MAG: hypothetical protein JWN78_2558 [Bacteroidota bacterium]|nr:hypothetical protein [Bacteroidota bacterium]